jgi:N-acetylmuramoyl-L-alanine amidase
LFWGADCNAVWATALLTLLLLASGRASEPQRLAVYAPQANFVLPVNEIAGKQYVGIFELLEPLSAPELKADGARWKLRVPDPGNRGKIIEANFEDGSASVLISGKKVILSAPAHQESARLLLPLHGIGSVLIPLLQTDVVFHEASRRLFLGGSAEAVTTEVRRGEPSTLALHFPAAVSPSISQEGNTLKLLFSKDPVTAARESPPLSDKLFRAETYSENNGTATITIAGSAPLLASFADNGKTIVISSAPSPQTTPTTTVAATAMQTAPPVSANSATSPVAMPEAHASASPQASHAPAPQISSAQAAFLVVIDPAHGGDDSGTRITPTLEEKDITLSLARRLRSELQARHIAADLLRDGDSNLSFDARAAKTNLERPALFISLHAEPGRAVNIYTPALPVALSTAIDKKSFLPWQTAQQAFLAGSTALAPSIAKSIGQREIPTQIRPAFLEPMHSIAAPAVAVEVPADRHGLRIPEEQIAGAIAEAVVVWKSERGAAQ